ncbi:MAG TPA: hypothetical protein VMG37_06560 [Solirubrobacteraceae bacterium]|nr:hypothetical protein [Solirubrobacteraceae bacterium]
MTTVTGTTPTRRIETRRLPRTTGALSGLLVILLGIWGGLIPFVGPYFHYAFGSYRTWHYTTERLWLCIVPGAVAVIGGLMLLRSSHRSSGLLGGWLGIAAGAWFAIGPSISLLWHAAGNPIGAPMGGHTRQAIEWLGYFSGLGVAIAALSAFAMGRYFSRPRLIEEAAVAADEAVEHERMAHEPVADRPVAERPIADHEAPVAATAAGEPVAAHEAEPIAARDREPLAERETMRDEPLAAREEDPATRVNEPVAPADEPVAPANEPVAGADEPAAPANEPVAPANEPGATGDGAAAGPATTTGPGDVTYRRRPGLSRFRRR